MVTGEAEGQPESASASATVTSIQTALAATTDVLVAANRSVAQLVRRLRYAVLSNLFVCAIGVRRRAVIVALVCVAYFLKRDALVRGFV